MSESRSPVVLFIPETGIYPYLRSLSVLGDSMKKGGENVCVTKCTGQMIRCVMMDLHRLPIDSTAEKKSELCKICAKILTRVQNRYGFSTIDLSGFVDPDLVRDINEMVDSVKGVKEDICYKGFPVGQLAKFDFTLATKYLYNKDLSAEHQLIYETYIKNISIVIAIVDSMCRKFKPSLLLTFGEYGHYQGARHATIINGVARKAVIHPMHLNADYSRFIIWSKTNEYFFYPHCQKWRDNNHLPISPKHVSACWDDSIYRFFNTGSSHIFSNRKQKDSSYVREKLNLRDGKKIVAVFTCSYDERQVKDIVMKVWGEGPRILDAFPSQIDWLSMLREYVSTKDDIQIVVRVHPREGLKQYGFSSQHLKQLKDKFVDNLPNFIMVWPDDPISSYDIMELADVCLVPWSLMGQEAARLGIPVLSCTGNMFYQDDDFIQVATEPQEYRKKLDSIINMEYNWSHLVKAIRFNHWRTFAPSLDLGETVPSSYNDDSIWPEAPGGMINAINDILKDKKDIIEYNIDKWKSSLSANAVEDEAEAVRRGIRYFIDVVYNPPAAGHSFKNILLKGINKVARKIAGRNIFKINNVEISFKDYLLKFYENVGEMSHYVAETSADQNLRVIVADGKYAIMVQKGKQIRKLSPMVVRLARLHESSLRGAAK